MINWKRVAALAWFLTILASAVSSLAQGEVVRVIEASEWARFVMVEGGKGGAPPWNGGLTTVDVGISTSSAAPVETRAYLRFGPMPSFPGLEMVRATLHVYARSAEAVPLPLVGAVTRVVSDLVSLPSSLAPEIDVVAGAYASYGAFDTWDVTSAVRASGSDVTFAFIPGPDAVIDSPYRFIKPDDPGVTGRPTLVLEYASPVVRTDGQAPPSIGQLKHAYQ